MIISASRRTDLPAFYGAWFVRRLRAGYCVVPNPMNGRQVARVALGPADVTAFVFWTRDPAPFLPALDELDARGYRYYFQFTITGYGAELEPHVPPLERQVAAFRALSARIGADRVIWRYDPILLSSRTPDDVHAHSFERLTDELAGSTRRVVVSLVDHYRKTERRLGALEQETGVTFERTRAPTSKTLGLLRHLRRVAEAHGLEIQSCAEPDVAGSGIRPGGCVDAALVRRLWGIPTDGRKDAGQREACGCTASKDIGVPDTCLHGCRYCYATRSHELALERHGEHDPEAAALWGRPADAERAEGSGRCRS